MKVMNGQPQLYLGSTFKYGITISCCYDWCREFLLADKSMIRLPFFLAKGFVAAESLDGAIPVIRRARMDGLHTTVDLLGEHLRDRDMAIAARDQYILLLRALSEERLNSGVDVNISIKLSMIGQVIDEDFCLENLRALLDVARETEGFIRLDMENSEIMESTLRLFDRVYADYPQHIGVVLQAYLKRTRQDVERMCDLGARVRLCKGAYNEPRSIAFQNMDAIRSNFVYCMEKLLHHGNYPAIATHDDHLIGATQAFADNEGIDRDRFEFQMLFGLRPKTQVLIAQQGYNMRVYIPYGNMWLPYYYRRLRERPQNIAFLLRNIFRA